MTEAQARRDFFREICPRIPPRDRPAAREAWSFFVDALHRDRRITDRQVQNWIGPNRCPRPGRPPRRR